MVSSFENGTSINYQFIRLLPASTTNPAYQNGRGQILYFLTDTQLNDALELSTAYLCDICSTKVINLSGSPITKFSVVRFAGYSVSSQLPSIELADATTSTNSPVMGIAEEDIADGSMGSVIISGAVSGIDTSGFILNQTVFLSDTPGAISTSAGTVESVVGRASSISTTGAITVQGEMPGGGGGSGATGATGITGNTGIQGFTGLGIQGVTGLEGAAGSTGIAGLQGSTGVGGGGGGSGFFTDGTGTDAAIGKGATAPTASGTNAVAQGDSSSASGESSFASGYSVTVNGNYSQGFGYDITVNDTIVFAAGYFVVADTGAYNCAHIGRNQYNEGHYSSFSVGNNNYFYGQGQGGYNILMGDNNAINTGAGTYTSYACIAAGIDNQVNYSQSGGAFGRNVEIAGAGGFAVDDRGNQSFGFGRDITLSGASNFGLGRDILTGSVTGAEAPSPNLAREVFAHGSNITIGRDYQKTWGSGVGGNYNSKVIRQLETVDDTQTTMFEMWVAGDKAYSVRIQLVGREQGFNLNAASWDEQGILIIGATGGATPTIIGGGTIAAANTNGTGSSLAFDINPGNVGPPLGGSVLFQVTGIAATDFRWCLCVEFTEAE